MSPLGDGSTASTTTYGVRSRGRHHAPPVVRRPLLVAERLEPFLHVAIELVVELLAVELQRLAVRIARAQDALAQREQELPQPFLAPPRLDELERRVAHRIGQPAGQRLRLEPAHLRDVVRERGVADLHEVEHVPVARHVVGQALVDPQRRRRSHDPARDDVELEDVRQLVGDEPVELVGRLVDRQHHPVAFRFREGEHALRHLHARDVVRLELALGLEEHQRDAIRQVVLQLGADELVGALGELGDPLQMRLDLRVEVDVEVVGLVDVPLELLVPDAVLAVIRKVWRLGGGQIRQGPRKNSKRASQEQERAQAHPHGVTSKSGT